MTEAVARERGRGTVVQRARVAALAGASWVACRLPDRLAVGLANLAGDLWYRVAPARRRQAERNLRRVVEELDRRAASGRAPGSAPAGRTARLPAASDAAVDRLVRRAFRHDARYYLEILRAPGLTAAVFDTVAIETPDAVEAAFSGGPVIFVSAHFGPIELPALYLANRSGRTFVAPMETIDDPPLQDWFERTRGSLGVRIVGLREARRALLTALKGGEHVGIVGDRDLGGGGIEVRFFGHPAPFPIGPALMALETGARIYAVGVRRLPDGGYAGGAWPVPVASEGTRRERIAATLGAVAAAFEGIIATAPEQWSGAFFPIWPDLAVPAEGGSAPARSDSA